MMAPYLLRLLCVCLAVFFVIHTAVGLLVSLFGPPAVRAAQRLRPRNAGRLLLLLRVLPAALATLVVAGLCVPSYLWLEPETGAEEVGVACLAAALLAATLWGLSIFRGARAAFRSVRNAETCEDVGRLSDHAASCWPVRIVDAGAPMLALVGLIRARVVITSTVLTVLSPVELDAALRHEDAHRISRDNLKRLLLMLLPGLLPGLRGFHTIEQGWARFAEWAADDAAVAGDPHVSIALASALVRMARLSGTAPLVPLCTPFLGDSREISVRVDRLLRPACVSPLAPRHGAGVVVVTALVASCAASMLHPATLQSAHRLIEQLIH